MLYRQAAINLFLLTGLKYGSEVSNYICPINLTLYSGNISLNT